MSPLITIIAILIIVSIITYFYANTYNALVLLNNKVLEDWKQVTLEINYRYELTMQYIKVIQNVVNPELINRITELESIHRLYKDNEKVINNYIDLEYALYMLFAELEDKKIKHNDWITAYRENKNRLNLARENYNNDVLAINNKVELFPSSIVGMIGRFNKQVYFRNEK